MEIPTRPKERLQKAGIDSCQSILMTCADLRKIADLTDNDVEIVKMCSAASLVTHKFRPASQAQWQFLSSGCKKLDRLLGGGFARWGITEVAGESGSGKTQLCLQAALSVQQPRAMGGLEAGAVYICTEDSFPSVRLQQLIEAQEPALALSHADTRLSDNIFIEHVPDAESLRTCICVRLPSLLLQKRIGLVVVDSIAGAFRADYEQQMGTVRRAEALRSIGHKLQLLAQEHCLAIICVNQVTTVPGEGCSTIVPALGLVWANLVTTRLQLHRTGNFVTQPTLASIAIAERHLEVVFCPYLEAKSALFVVTKAGVQGLNKPTT